MAITDRVRRWRSQSTTDAAQTEADNVSMRRIDEAAAVPRPSTVGTTYVESEYAAKAHEQEYLFGASGEAAARRHQVRAAGLQLSSDEAVFVVGRHRGVVEQAREQYQHAVRILTPFVRRDRWAVYRYLGAWLFLGLGDTAGVLGAAISLGEVPLVALGQALATGVAAVTAGQVGSDVKNLRLGRQRQRDPNTLSPDEQSYRHLFDGIDTGLRMLWLAGAASVSLALLVTVGIFTLRLSVEGMVAGLAFGGLAGATVLGSFLAAYSYADEVAEIIATSERRYRKALTRHRKLAAASALRRHATASARAQSLVTEFHLRGRAASRRLASLCQRILGRNGQVMGHGPAADAPAPGADHLRYHLNGHP
jgi:hypothetical protein